jgi:ABC-type transport system involved in multi-copper enzyme maturation permease subunit
VSLVVISETLRRHLTSVGYIVAVAFIGVIALGVSKFNQPAAAWPSLITILALAIGSGAVGPEFSRGTLQLILTKPINRSIYLLSRVAGLVLTLWIAIAAAGALEAFGRMAWGDSAGLDVLGARILNTAANAILICAVLVLLGSLTRAYWNAAIYVALLTALNVGEGLLGMLRMTRTAIGQFVNDHSLIQRSVAAVHQNLFPDVPISLSRGWLLLVLSNAALALVLACFAFRRREVPYGAD